MNTDTHDKIRQIAREFAKAETKFACIAVTAVEITNNDSRGECFVVKLTLSHSAEDIEKIVSAGDPNEAEVAREFLEGDFKLKLVVAGDAVIASEWENMDVC